MPALSACRLPVGPYCSVMDHLGTLPGHPLEYIPNISGHNDASNHDVISGHHDAMELDDNCNRMGPPHGAPLHNTKMESWNNNGHSFSVPNLSLGTNQKEICAGCRRPIEDRFLLRVMDNSWHETCLQCSLCQEPLQRSCFVKDRKLLCRADYEKLYGARCHGCMQPVPAHELVMRALGQVYHLRCFICVICGHQLQKGDQFVVKDGHLYCRMDFEKEFCLNLSPKTDWYSAKSDDDSSIDDNCDLDAPKGPKRPRTILTTSQRRKFKSSFEINPKPCRKVRETLAAETGLSVRVVQVWFQNQRAKMKKIARRQTTEGDGKEGKGGKNGQKNKSKKEEDDDASPSSADNCQGQTDENQNVPQSMDPPPHSQPKSSLTSPSPTNLLENQLTPYNNPSTNSQDLYSSGVSDSLYGSSLGIDSSLDTLGDMLMGQTPPTTTSSSQSHAGNPIDKLYSMQSSYFTAD